MPKVKSVANVRAFCVACGNCVKYCPLRAITIYKGIHAVVDEEKCVGCGKCVKNCPAGVISKIAKEEKNNGK